MADRDFKGVWIPREVWLDKNLTMLDKGILTEIDSLDMGENGCFASNEHLADFCQCSERKVTESVSKLINLGYVKVISFDGRKRFLRSCLAFSAMQNGKNCKAEWKNLRDSNTSIRPLNKPDNSISSIDDDFSTFWAAYPRKVSKPAALRAWKSLKADSALTDRIIADIQRRCDTEWKDQPMQYIPHPSTYLNQRRWEDETAPTEREATHRGIDPKDNPALQYTQREYKAEDYGKDFFFDYDKEFGE